MQLRLSQMSSYTRKVLWVMQQSDTAMTADEIARLSSLPLPMVTRTLYQQRNKNLPSVHEALENGVKKYSFARDLIELINDIDETEAGSSSAPKPPMVEKPRRDSVTKRKISTPAEATTPPKANTLSAEDALCALSKPMSIDRLADILKRPVSEVSAVLNTLSRLKHVKIEKVFGTPVYTRLLKNSDLEERTGATNDNREQKERIVIPSIDDANVSATSASHSNPCDAVKWSKAVRKIRLSLLTLNEALKEIEELIVSDCETDKEH